MTDYSTGNMDGFFDFCFVGSGVILNRLLSESFFANSRILIISDHFINEPLSRLASFDLTVRSREALLHTSQDFKVGTLIILVKTHRWLRPKDFEVLIQGLRDHVSSRVIHISSGSVYGETFAAVNESSPTNPLTNYGAHKVLEERIVSDTFNSYVKVIILRVSNVFGDVSIEDFVNQGIRAAVEEKWLPIYSNGSIFRDYLYIDCLIGAILTFIVLNLQKDSITLNVSSGKSTSISELVKDISCVTGLPIKVVNQVRPENIVEYSLLDNSALVATTPWEPVSIREGIRLYINRSFPEFSKDA